MDDEDEPVGVRGSGFQRLLADRAYFARKAQQQRHDSSQRYWQSFYDEAILIRRREMPNPSQKIGENYFDKLALLKKYFPNDTPSAEGYKPFVLGFFFNGKFRQAMRELGIKDESKRR